MSIFADQVEAIRFQLQALTDLSKLQQSGMYAHFDQDMVDMMLDQAARFSEEHLLPLAASGDKAGCRLQNNQVSLPEGTRQTYEQWCHLGFPALALPLEYDGLQCPAIIQSAIQEIGDAANMAFGMLPINLRCAALTLLRYASPALKQRFVPGLVTGTIASTIVISEAQAGSDVGRIRTRAKPVQGSDHWLISGEKIWISYGDHDATGQILHLVLARVPDAKPGIRGLALFAVPKYLEDDCRPESRNTISISRIEEKMGLHASPTCVLEFNEACAWLVGEAERGIQNLFVMMNAMRLAVSVQGSAVANAATLHALKYARERPQGGNPQAPPLMIAEHADVKRMLLDMTASSELLRALSLKTAFYLDLAACAEDPDQAETASRLADLLLPLAKTLAAETGFEVASQGIQVLGGYGYTSDYPLERLARDIRVASIYEGTSGIQAKDFLIRKVCRDDASTLKALLHTIRQDLSASNSSNPMFTGLAECLDRFASLTDELVAAQQHSAGSVDGNAYAYLRLAGHLVSGWCCLLLLESGGTGTDSAYLNRLVQALTLSSTQFTLEFNYWYGCTGLKQDYESITL